MAFFQEDFVLFNYLISFFLSLVICFVSYLIHSFIYLIYLFIYLLLTFLFIYLFTYFFRLVINLIMLPIVVDATFALHCVHSLEWSSKAFTCDSVTSLVVAFVLSRVPTKVLSSRIWYDFCNLFLI
jgi:hypothetical protein